MATGQYDAPTPGAPTTAPDRVETVIYAVVIIVIAFVPVLAFAFSFGNVGLLGISLGIDPRIAYLTGPAVDLSVVGLIVAGTYLSHRGWSDRALWPVHLMSVLCGAAMIALNCGQSVYQNQWRKAAFDAVGPLLLIGWGFLGPWLLRQLADARARRTAGAADAESSTTAEEGPSTGTVQPPIVDERPPSSESSTPPSTPPTVHRPAAPSSDRPRRPSTGRAKPSTPPPSTGQPDMDEWVRIGHPVYLDVRDTVGKRPPESDFQDALGERAAKLIARGELPACYAEPSLSTAKRVRKEIETRFPELSPLHLVTEEAS